MKSTSMRAPGRMGKRVEFFAGTNKIGEILSLISRRRPGELQKFSLVWSNDRRALRSDRQATDT